MSPRVQEEEGISRRVSLANRAVYWISHEFDLDLVIWNQQPTIWKWHEFSESMANIQHSLVYMPILATGSTSLEANLHETEKQVSGSIETNTDAMLRQVFIRAFEESFEDGMETKFSHDLEQAVIRGGPDSVLSLAEIVRDKRTNPGIAGEALRVLGRMRHPETHEIRCWLLETSLSSRLACIRDSAVLGIAFLDDPSSKAALAEAIANETLAELKRDMQAILKEMSIGKQ